MKLHGNELVQEACTLRYMSFSYILTGSRTFFVVVPFSLYQIPQATPATAETAAAQEEAGEELDEATPELEENAVSNVHLPFRKESAINACNSMYNRLAI